MPDLDLLARGRSATPRLSTRRRWRWLRGRMRVLAVVIVAAVLVLGGVWMLYFSSLLTARTVEVVGVQTISPVRVREVAKVPVGTPLARLDLSAIQARVESISAVRDAQISRAWPHTVRITIVERTPVAVVDRGSGLQEVDRSGVLFGSPSRRPAGLPLVRAGARTSTDELAQAASVASALPTRLARRVDFIQLRSLDDIVLQLRNGQTVVWGSAASSTQKAEVVAELLTNKVHQVDVSVPGRPTTR